MKYCLISDLHLRGFEYHEETLYTFERLYESLASESPDCIVLGGDLYHSKLQVTNEYFVIAKNLIKTLSDFAPVVIIPGNHDVALNNPSRLDAITPVVEALQKMNLKNEIHYLKHSQQLEIANATFHHFSILDSKNKWPNKKDYKKDKINIGLYHGDINGCIYDNDWVSRGNKDSLELFDGLDCVFLGDIHKRQFLTPTIAYPGSLRQNNYGEDLQHGYMVWEINSKTDIKGRFIDLDQLRYFFTVQINSIEEAFEDLGLPKDSRIRIKAAKKFTLAEETKIKNFFKRTYEPKNEVTITYIDKNTSQLNYKIDGEIIDNENIRLDSVQKRLIQEYFKGQKLTKKQLQKICEIDEKYNHEINKEEYKRNVSWDIKQLKWDNFFSYKENNIIDFDKLAGIVGIIGANAVGKSAAIDSILYALDNTVYREGANKNVDYINDRKEQCSVELSIGFDDSVYKIIRKTTKSVTKKGEEKAANSIDFFKEKDGSVINLKGTTDPDTNMNIRNIFGTSEDFAITSLCPQWGLSKFIDSKGTERKKIFAKFMDLNLFEEKCLLAAKDYSYISKKCEEWKDKDFDKEIEDLSDAMYAKQDVQKTLQSQLADLRKEFSALEQLRFDKMTGHFAPKNINNNQSAEQIQIQISSIDDKIKELSTKIEKLLIQKEETSRALDNKSLDDLLGTKKDIDKVTAKLQKLLAELPYKKRECERVDKKIESFSQQKICGQCPLLAERDSIQNESISVKNEYALIEGQVTKLQLLLNKLDPDTIAKLISLCFSLAETEKNLSKAQNDLDQLDRSKKQKESILSDIKSNEFIISESNRISKEVDEIRVKSKQKESEISEVQIKINVIDKEIAVLENQISALKSSNKTVQQLLFDCYAYELYLDAMGKNGIGYSIMSKKIPVINQEVNMILSQVANFKIEIENNEEEKTIKIYMIDQKGKRIIELCSGAEKTIAALALRTALWQISNLPKSSVLILDECFSFLDDQRLDGVINMLQYLKNYFKTILVITHNADLKTVMDSIVYVEKDEEGFSYCKN